MKDSSAVSMTMDQFAPSPRAHSKRWLRLVITFGLGATALFGAGVGTTQAGTPPLSVHVYCYSNPERVVVRNNRSFAITIRSVGSRYQPYSYEPVRVDYRLGAGRSVTFYSGNGATYSNPRTLTRNYIFHNEVGSTEGAKVTRSNGVVFGDRC